MVTPTRLTSPRENTGFSVPWKAGDVAVGVFAALVALGLTYPLYPLFAGDSNLGMGLGLVVIGGVSGVVMLLLAWVLGPVRYDAPAAALGFRLPAKPGLARWALPIGALAVSLVLTAVYTNVVDWAGWDFLKPPGIPEGIALGGPAVVVTYLMVVLWTPLTEEVFFRGFIFPGLAGALGVVPAGIATSVLFALAHGDVAVLVPIFVTGLVLAWLYHRTGSIWSSFAAHALQNLLALSVGLAS